jgi:hypothetical protein
MQDCQITAPLCILVENLTMATSEKLVQAFRLFDAANGKDPNTEEFRGKTYPREVLYALRMTEKLNSFSPNASEALQLAARCQHICRWEIPRETYDMNRQGYLKWRRALKKFHVQKATEILKEVGYSEELIDRVCLLLEKKQLKRDEESQTLEDVICMVFLECYFDAFALKHTEEKITDILKKTWRKMSESGRNAAMALPYSERGQQLINTALK